MAQATNQLNSWDEFNRMKDVEDFFAIVREDGTWEDSAVGYNAALHWCCMADGQHLDSVQAQINHIGRSKWSIIHSSMLRKMYNVGLIK